MNYQEQFNKLTEAYISGKVNPFQCKACFVGNLLGGSQWSTLRETWKNFSLDPDLKDQNIGGYSAEDIVLLEHVFMTTYVKNHRYVKANPEYYNKNSNCFTKVSYDIDEDALFLAFEKTLALLKEVHEDMGEVINYNPVFKKRQLC